MAKFGDSGVGLSEHPLSGTSERDRAVHGVAGDRAVLNFPEGV